MTDFMIKPFDFAATEVTIYCVSEAARVRFDGAPSVNVRKSALPDFMARAEVAGLTFEFHWPNEQQP